MKVILSKIALAAGISLAMAFTFSACSSDDSGTDNPPPVSSDSSGGGEEQKVFCKLTAGNCSQMSLSTCMELVNAGSAQIVANCNTEPEPSLSSSSYAPSNTQSSSSVLLSSSSITPSSSSVVIFGYCSYGPVKADGTGGCFPMATDDDAANCTAWGQVVSACPVFDSFVYLGQTYKIVKIGNQWWMAENLNRSMWNETSTITAGICYRTLDYNCNEFGRLYTWAEAMGLPSSCNTSNTGTCNVAAKHQGLCPGGWHIPSRDEWNTLVTYVGTNPETKLKAKSPAWNGMDTYGFSALPAGAYTSNSIYDFIDTHGFWWTATGSVSTAYGRRLHSSDAGVFEGNYEKNQYISVRCVKN